MGNCSRLSIVQTIALIAIAAIVGSCLGITIGDIFAR
jgi:hypothetical protein